MTEIGIPVIIVSGLGLLFGIVLSYASKKFEVKPDENIEKIRELLPGANCGACGFTGCDQYGTRRLLREEPGSTFALSAARI